MIDKVHVKHFKRFADQSFDLKDSIILAGTNNAGKSTLLQAISVWNLAFTKWRQARKWQRRARANCQDEDWCPNNQKGLHSHTLAGNEPALVQQEYRIFSRRARSIWPRPP
ncbi:MAG: AAA family ATPase [bacterium]|nr:AAA family ATPase [bacterium]